MRRKLATLIVLTAAVLAVVGTNAVDQAAGQESTTSVVAEPGWSVVSPAAVMEPGWS